MLEKIINILEKFLEKYFIPSLVAILPTTTIYYFTCDNFSLLLKLGKQLYVFVMYVTCFLIIELLIYLFKLFRLKREEKIFEEESNAKSIVKIREAIDMLGPNERKLLNLFLENNNEPIITIESFEFLFADKYCNHTKIFTENNTQGINIHTFEKEKYKKGYQAHKYKLKDDIYAVLKNMLDNNIKISNF